jgi:hypothetical protein
MILETRLEGEEEQGGDGMAGWPKCQTRETHVSVVSKELRAEGAGGVAQLLIGCDGYEVAFPGAVSR